MGNFRFSDPVTFAYDLGIWRQQGNNTQHATLIKNLYDTELALYELDGQVWLVEG